MKKFLIVLVVVVLTTSCSTHMTAVKYSRSQLSYCPPDQRAGYVNPNTKKGNNFSYSKAKHRSKRDILKSLKDTRSYKAPKSHYKNYLPSYKYKRYKR